MAPARDILHPSSLHSVELLTGPRLTRNLSHRARDEGIDWGQTRQQEQIVSQEEPQEAQVSLHSSLVSAQPLGDQQDFNSNYLITAETC